MNKQMKPDGPCNVDKAHMAPVNSFKLSGNRK